MSKQKSAISYMVFPDSQAKIDQKQVDQMVLDLVRTMAGTVRKTVVYLQNELAFPVSLKVITHSEYIKATVTPRIEGYGKGSIEFTISPPKDLLEPIVSDWELEVEIGY